jgi:hypothetical protein
MVARDRRPVAASTPRRLLLLTICALGQTPKEPAFTLVSDVLDVPQARFADFGSFGVAAEPAFARQVRSADEQRDAVYDLILMNGCLHYVCDKTHVLQRVLAASTADAVHTVALFSTVTPVPAEHAAVPVFPDSEDGVVEGFYQDWTILLRAREHAQREHSHPGFAPHVHSYIKLIAARTTP